MQVEYSSLCGGRGGSRNLVSELQEARDYLQSEGERIRAEVAHYAALAGAASASVKIIFDVLRAWRTTGHPAHNQSQASAFEMTDAVTSDWLKLKDPGATAVRRGPRKTV